MSHDPRLPGGDRDPLTPEERALADRLARSGPQGGPSPALDARILEAARAAAGAGAPASAHRAPPARRHPRRRWPVAFGAAATLVIVGGLAWQLRPVDDMQVGYSEAPRAASGPSADAVAPVARQRQVAPAPAKTTAPAVAETASQPPAADTEAAPAPVPAPKPAADAADASDTRREQQRVPTAFPPPPAEPPVVFDEPSPMDTPAPPPAPPAPPAPAVPVAPAPPPEASPVASPAPTSATDEASARAAEARAAKAGTEKARLQRAEVTPARRAPQPAVASGTTAHAVEPAAASAGANADELDSVVVTGTRRVDGFTDQPIDDQPPASADSPRVQDAWLRRVRQLVSEGRLEDARESLREYQHRYPKATLPEDLRALLAD